jgi:hypothetical protein
MKSFLLSLMVVLTTMLNAQTTYMVTVHTGMINSLRGTLRASEDLSDNTSATYSGFSPFGLRATTKINDRTSFGIDLIYGTASVNFDRVDTIFSNGQWNYITNEHDVTIKRLRTQFRFNRHFGTNPNFDQYVGVAVGNNKRWRKELINDTLVTPETSDTAFPISTRLCYGFNYYPIYNLAVGAEFGIGGPLIQASVSYRF